MIHPSTERRRLAIVGAGSSGLISLKYALETLADWQIDCFEESDSIVGAWGNPYPGFVSTSTKYTTQFSCFALYDASVAPDGGEARCEFFREGEFGEYLSRFVDHFDLRRHVQFQHHVTAIRREPAGNGWELTYSAGGSPPRVVRYDAVIICTGLVAEPKTLNADPVEVAPRLICSGWEVNELANQTVVVIGGGEMAADFANRLARPDRGNRVFLSLRSGIRISPRYHPIRGVPSDFLRNRLLLSIHQDLRNSIGQRFVSARIRYQEWFARLFPPVVPKSVGDPDVEAERKRWAIKLNQRAARQLFDMFHNKSDDFLMAIAQGRLSVVGPPVDSALIDFEEFDGAEVVNIDPDVVVPAIGFRSRIRELTGGLTDLRDFYHGCCHIRHDGLFVVGFARPVIGNIPSISEMQARYVVQVIADKIQRPPDIVERHASDTAERCERFANADISLIYPVEMFPYCDRLAEEIGVAVRCRSLREWWRVQTSPATTLDYACFDEARRALPPPPTYLPWSLIALLFALKPVDWLYRRLRRRR